LAELEKARLNAGDKGFKMSATGAAADNKHASASLKTQPQAVLKVLNALPLLSQKELWAVLAAVEAALAENIDIDRDLYFLVFELVGEKPLPVAKFAKSSNGAVWKQNYPAFQVLKDKLIEGKALRRSQALALDKFLLEILIEDIKEQHLPVTLKSICSGLGSIEGSFDRGYPDYLKSGPLRRLILSKIIGG
jgi:hypothetical protein